MKKLQAITEPEISPELRHSATRQQLVDTSLARSNTSRTAILDGVEKQLKVLVGAVVDGKRAASGTKHCETKRATIAVHRDRAPGAAKNIRGFRSAFLTGALLVTLGFCGWCACATVQYLASGNELTGAAAVNAVVDRIIGVESNHRFDATSKTSSAAGTAQFIEETWLNMIRMHRPDLGKVRTKAETLDLRRDPTIAREITTRFAERNAALLKKRGLPVTASTVYLAHFAGGAGAVAILSAENNADAASIMAKADATGRINREQIVKANPFLQQFSVGDLKRWAERKMLGPPLILVGLSDSGVHK